MAPNPLVLVACLAVVLISLAPAARTAPTPPVVEEAPAEDRQRQLGAPEQPRHRQQQQADQLGIAPLVNSLLTSLLRQTLYTRMENLLLDGSPRPPSSRFPSSGDSAAAGYPSHHESVRKSGERRRIVDSAVRNYQEQDGGLAQDFTKLAGKFHSLLHSFHAIFTRHRREH